MISIKEKIDTARLNAALKSAGKISAQIIKNAFELTSIDAQKFVRLLITSRLKQGDGRLRSSVRPLSVRQKGSSIWRAGISVGTRYAVTHIGKRGSSLIIRPRNKQWLTIPLTNVKGGATTKFFGNTFFATSRKGNLILFGSPMYQRGKRAGQARGGIIPLFVLKKKVTIRRRVYTDEILARMRKDCIEHLKKEKVLWLKASSAH